MVVVFHFIEAHSYCSIESFVDKHVFRRLTLFVIPAYVSFLLVTFYFRERNQVVTIKIYAFHIPLTFHHHPLTPVNRVLLRWLSRRSYSLKLVNFRICLYEFSRKYSDRCVLIKVNFSSMVWFSIGELLYFCLSFLNIVAKRVNRTNAKKAKKKWQLH